LNGPIKLYKKKHGIKQLLQKMSASIREMSPKRRDVTNQVLGHKNRSIYALFDALDPTSPKSIVVSSITSVVSLVFTIIVLIIMVVRNQVKS